MNYSWEIIKISVYLLLVLGLIYLFAYFMKNRLQGPKSNKYIEILESVHIMPKRNLSLVKINDKILLLGHTEQNLNVLESWDLNEFTEITSEENRYFKDYIYDFLEKKGSMKSERDKDE
ncbi:flagellar biosynthetic protein FliO [Natronospora cellulosivora (SeqCode)]